MSTVKKKISPGHLSNGLTSHDTENADRINGYALTNNGHAHVSNDVTNRQRKNTVIQPLLRSCLCVSTSCPCLSLSRVSFIESRHVIPSLLSLFLSLSAIFLCPPLLFSPHLTSSRHATLLPFLTLSSLFVSPFSTSSFHFNLLPPSLFLQGVFSLPLTFHNFSLLSFPFSSSLFSFPLLFAVQSNPHNPLQNGPPRIPPTRSIPHTSSIPHQSTPCHPLRSTFPSPLFAIFLLLTRKHFPPPLISKIVRFLS